MTSIRKLAVTSAIAALVGLGGLAASSTAASAYTVCNRWGECWHENNRYYNYPPGIGIRYHDDDGWYGRHRHIGRRYWRHHHDGRGYWRSGVWIRF